MLLIKYTKAKMIFKEGFVEYLINCFLSFPFTAKPDNNGYMVAMLFPDAVFTDFYRYKVNCEVCRNKTII